MIKYTMKTRFTIPVESDPQAKLPWPHWRDSYWGEERLVYKHATVIGGGVEYSDRMGSRHRDKWDAAISNIPNTVNHNTAEYWEFLFSYLLGRQVIVTEIYAAANAASGHPYWGIRYTDALSCDVPRWDNE